METSSGCSRSSVLITVPDRQPEEEPVTNQKVSSCSPCQAGAAVRKGPGLQTLSSSYEARSASEGAEEHSLQNQAARGPSDPLRCSSIS